MLRFVGNVEALDKASFNPACGTDPTPEQIANRAAAIRAGWSERQRLSRRVTKKSFPLPPMVRVEDWFANVAAALRN
jgi:hypothetical protein